MAEDEFDVDAAVETLLPWKLRLKIGGKWHATRPPSMGQLGALMLLKDSKSKGSEQQTIDIVKQMFVNPEAALAAMTPAHFVIAAAKIVSYAKDEAAKN